MKRIYLLRHAQALPGNGMRDIDRVLSPKGEADAKALGTMMLAKSYVPEMVYCSPAVRTRMTLSGVTETVNGLKVEFVDDIYYQGTEVYLDLINGLDESVRNVMIVGHNPSVHAVAAGLAMEDGSDLLGQLINAYAPGTLSVFETDRPWLAVRQQQNKLIDLLTP